MKRRYIKSLSIILSSFILATSLNLNDVIVKADTNTLYDKQEQVPKEVNGKKLIKVEEVVDKNDTEELNIVANHTFKYRYDLPHTIWKELNPQFNSNYPEVEGNFRWNVGVKDGSGNLIPYDSVWYKDYKVEMALISKSGSVKLDKEQFIMNGSPVNPLLVNGAIPDATAYFGGSGAIVSAWENPCWDSNKPKGYKSNTFKPPTYISNSNGVYKGINTKNNDQPLELYLPNPKNQYTLPACEYEPNPPSIMSLTYPKPTPPDSRVHKGTYATTNRVFTYGRVKYKGIYEGDTSTGGGGEIKFDPYETDWTNKGKTAESQGAYPIRVYYDGTNPVTLEGTATVDTSHYETVSGTDSKGKPTSHQVWVTSSESATFPVTYTLESITVTGSTNETVSGASGTVNIRKEGGDLKLHGVGHWGQPKYSLPPKTISSNIPPKPNEPQGDSGIYKIDWTKTNINVDNPNSKWVNSPVPNPVRVSVTDNLSGFDDKAKVTVADSSHYNNNAEDSLPNGGLSYDKTIMLSDGIYKINVFADDRATNQNSKEYKTYYIDGTKPTVDFNIKPGIFSEANGAVRKQSTKGKNFAFYGNLTASDNLSGVAKLQYKWTYGNNKPSSGYEVIYTSPYTYSDRYQERINKEIEKPVGDDLYIHVELWDTAGNYTYKSFGPYEDPIKLKNFQVTDVRDPRWDDVFWKDKEFKEPTGKAYTVNQLPVDDNSHPTLRNAFPKKGYAFYFDVTSEFLYRQKDRIEIKPSFYYIKDGQRIAVDCYYNYENNPLVKMGSQKDGSVLTIKTQRYDDVLIGNFSQLVLTRGVRLANGKEWLGNDGWKDQIQYEHGKEQWWYGKYFIPASSIFVKQGDSPRPENVLKDEKIVINFQLIAYKNGIETMSSDQIFGYVPSQWELEGGPKDKKYKDGDVIVYDNKYSAMSDYKTHVIQ